MDKSTGHAQKIHLSMLVLLTIILVWSGIEPYRTISWLSIAAPTVLYVAILISLYRQVKFTTFAYCLVFLQVIVFLIGAKYTYEHNPLFNTLKETFHWNRNHFDRFAHFTQGFIPFFLIKEYLLKKGILKRNTLLAWIVIGLVLGLTALYEILEFAAALITNQPIVSPQGDPWDTNWDMVMAFLGTIIAHFIFGKFHDSQMEKEGFKNKSK